MCSCQYYHDIVQWFSKYVLHLVEYTMHNDIKDPFDVKVMPVADQNLY